MYTLGRFLGANRYPVMAAVFGIGVMWLSILFSRAIAPTEFVPPVSVPVVEKPAQPTEGDLRINRAITFGRSLKASSKDPSSFKMESFLYFDSGATCYEYRAKNSYAAIIPGRAVYDGGLSMLTSERDGNKFVKQWNAICTKGGGVDRIQGLNYLNVW